MCRLKPTTLDGLIPSGPNDAAIDAGVSRGANPVMHPCGSAALDSSCVTSARHARVFCGTDNSVRSASGEVVLAHQTDKIVRPTLGCGQSQP